MKLAVIKTIKKEDLSKAGEVPEWGNALIEALNPFIETVGQALQGNLDFENNFQSRQKKLKFKSGVESSLNPDSGKLRVAGVIPLSAGGLNVSGFKWVQKTDGNIGVTFTFAGGGEATCELLLLLR